MIHIYVAGPYPRRAEAEALANELWAAGFVVTSRWHSGPEQPCDRKAIMQNWCDLETANAIVALVYPECKGALVEIGGAIMSDSHDVFLVGRPKDSPTPMIDMDKVNWLSVADGGPISNQLLRFYPGAEDPT